MGLVDLVKISNLKHFSLSINVSSICVSKLQNLGSTTTMQKMGSGLIIGIEYLISCNLRLAGKGTESPLNF